MKRILFLISLLSGMGVSAQYPIHTEAGTGYIDSNGKVLANPGMFKDGTRFSEGLAAITLDEEAPKHWFFVGTDFKIKVPYAYDSTGHFSSGLCPVKKNGRWFYVGPNGLSRIDGPYDEASDFHDGFARVRKGGGWFLINEAGESVLTVPYEEISPARDSTVALKPQGSKYWFLYHLRGDTLLSDSFYALSTAVNGVVYANRLGGHVYLRLDGSRYLDRSYIGAVPFGDRYGCVREEKFWFLIDNKGKVKSDIKLLAPVVLNQPLNKAQNYNGVWGYLNREGRWVYLPQ